MRGIRPRVACAHRRWSPKLSGTRPISSAWAVILRLWSDERGVSAVVLAVSLTAMIGFVALGAEAGLWYSIKRQNQSAADAAVIAVAYEILAGKTDPTTNLIPAATEAAARNGYSGDTPAVTYPYADAIVSNGVAVTLRKTQGALLASLFLPSVTIETKAVATLVPASPGCVLSLNKSGTDVGVSGSSQLTAPDCSIMAASTDNCSINLHDQGGVIQAKYLITAGQVSYGQGCNTFDPTNPPSNLQANLMTGVSSQQFTDPYGALSGTTSFTDPCTGTGGYLSHSFLTCNIPPATNCALPPTSGSVTVYTGNQRFCGGLPISGSSGTAVDLLPPTSGAIVSVNVTAQGSNYKPNGCVPTVTFGGGGSGATAIADVQGQTVRSITVTSPGSGYPTGSSVPVTISLGSCTSGSGATATATAENTHGVFWITDDGCSAASPGCGDLALGSNGTLECTQCDPATGKGVTIIFTSTKASLIKIGAPTGQSNPRINSLNAPGSGTYAGLLMVQDTVDGATYTTTAKFQGNPDQKLNGLIYTPHSNLEFQGSPSVTNSCLLVVANTMTLDGASSLATGGCPTTLPLPTVKTVALAS
jgi:Flp pilus assembly protein TadG